MKVVYTGDKIDKDCISCFLAGPTPRSSDVSSWRDEAISLFSKRLRKTQGKDNN